MYTGTKLILVAILFASCKPQDHAFTYSVLRQRTSAGRNAGQPETLTAETVFGKNDLLAIEIQIPQAGYFYAFQADDQGTFDVLFPPSAGSHATQSGQKLRLPTEEKLWLGFISSTVTLAWSPRRIESLELAIDRSEVEEDSIRAIRDPQDVKRLDQILNELLSGSQTGVVAHRIPLRVD